MVLNVAVAVAAQVVVRGGIRESRRVIERGIDVLWVKERCSAVLAKIPDA